jgi:hypothetical protein
LWNVYLLETKKGGSVKQFSLSILILFLFYACGGGGGGGYTPPAEEQPAEEQTGCVSSSTNFCVKVVSTAGGNKYSIDGTTQKTLTLTAGTAYTFDQTDSTNANHPLALSETANGTHASGTAYTTGVASTGTAGSTGKTTFTPASNAPTPLYYFCTNHSGMGGTTNISGTSGGSGYSIPSKVEPIDTQ